jgi:hypothetical protein
MIACGLVTAAIGVVAGIRRAGAADTASPGFRSYAKYLTEEDAIRHGDQMGLGEATLEAPSNAIVDSFVQLKLKFRVGRAGMKTGGGIRLATAHGMGGDWGGMSLQITDSGAANYLTFGASTGATIQWKSYSGVGQNPLFNRYHPWQFLNEFKLTGAPLKEGDSIEIAMGGTPGVRLQQWDEKAFVLKFYVDALGDDDYLPLKKSPAFRIAAGPAKVLHAIGPSDAETGKPTWLNVWAEDGFGNPSDSYRGMIAFDAADASGLPAEYTFREADQGAHRFEGVVLRTSGAHRIQVREKNGALTAESNPLVVRDQSSRERIYWGDIHTHTMYSDGRGTPEDLRFRQTDFSARFHRRHRSLFPHRRLDVGSHQEDD